MSEVNMGSGEKRGMEKGGSGMRYRGKAGNLPVP